MGSRAAAGCSVPNARAREQTTNIKKAKKGPCRLGKAKPGNIIAYGYLMRIKQL